MRVKLILTFLIIVSFAFGQSKSEWLEYADEAFTNQDYTTAADFYLKVLDTTQTTPLGGVYPYEVKHFYQSKKKTETDSSSAGLSEEAQKTNYFVSQLAESYRLSHQYEKAELWYKKAVELSPANTDKRVWYAEMLIRNLNYLQASKELELYMSANEGKDSPLLKKADMLMFSCELAMSEGNKKNDENVVSELDSNINRGVSSFAPAFGTEAGSIFFTTSVLGRKGKELNQSWNCDIFKANIEGSGFEGISPVTGPINTFDHEGTAVLSPDKSKMYFTRWDNENKEIAIYVSRFLNGMPLQPMKLNENVNLTGFKSMQPAFSEDGAIMYFSSDRPGGKGKMDLWFCRIDEFGNTGEPVNLAAINTPDDEVSPFLNPATKTLYFSSRGHIGFGGLDIFKAYASDTLFISPRNLGLPINSSGDDSYFIIDEQELNGYFTSDRKVCTHCPTSNCYKIYSLKNKPVKFTVSGKVYNQETKKPIPNALVAFEDVKGLFDEFFVITDENGYYSQLLHEDMEIYLKAQKVKYFADAGTITTKGLKVSTDLVKDFYLKQIPSGDIVIPGIEYDYDKATLRPASKKIIDELVEFFQLNSNIIIEISSHTDARGSDEYNYKLSHERAKSVVDYLVSKGIEAERLKPQGYGETKLLVVDAKNEEEHQKNRRTAFRILSEDYRPAKNIKIPDKK